MKINIWLNDYYNRYNLSVKKTYSHIDVELFNSIIDSLSDDDLIILRGEPTIHPFLWQILNKLNNKNYILSTESSKPEPLVKYKKHIPYLSFRYDGFMNDVIRGKRPLTLNMFTILSEFSARETTLRLEYTISPYNLEFLEADILNLRLLVSKYSRMKQPYFVIYQQSEIYDQTSYAWTSLSKNKIQELNKKSLLTEKNLKFFDAWLNKRETPCMSPRNEIVIDSSGIVRLCHSLRFHETLGDLKNDSLSSILEKSSQVRNNAIECPLRKQCWMAYHYKDNVYG